jgi:predicted RNase H-like HicB family nuclease
METMYSVSAHHETEPDPHYWAEVPELPGCFAIGDTLDELGESLREALALYLNVPVGEVGELKIYVTA